MKSCFVKRLSSSSGLWPPTGLFYMSLSSLWRGHSGRTPWMDNFAWWRIKLLYWTILKIFHLRIIWITERSICRKRMQAGFHYGHLLDSGLFSSSTYVSLLLEKGDKYRQENNNVPSYIDCDSIFSANSMKSKRGPRISLAWECRQVTESVWWQMFWCSTWSKSSFCNPTTVFLRQHLPCGFKEWF